MKGTKRKDETGEIFEVLSEPYIVGTEKNGRYSLSFRRFNCLLPRMDDAT